MDTPDLSEGKSFAELPDFMGEGDAVSVKFDLFERAKLHGSAMMDGFEKFNEAFAGKEIAVDSTMIYFAAKNRDPRVFLFLLKQNPELLSLDYKSAIDLKTTPLINRILMDAEPANIRAMLSDAEFNAYLRTAKFSEGNNILHCFIDAMNGVICQDGAASKSGSSFIGFDLTGIRRRRMREMCEVLPEFFETFPELVADRNSAGLNVLEYTLKKRDRSFKFSGSVAEIEKEIDNLRQSINVVNFALLQNNPLIILESDLVEKWHKLTEGSSGECEKYASQEEAVIDWYNFFLINEKSKNADRAVSVELLHGLAERGFSTALPAILGMCSDKHSKALKQGLCQKCLEAFTDVDKAEDCEFAKVVVSCGVLDAGNIDVLRRRFDAAIADGDTESAHKFLAVPGFYENVLERFENALGSKSKAAPENLRKIVAVFPEFLDKFAQTIEKFDGENVDILKDKIASGEKLKAAEKLALEKIKILHPEGRRSEKISKLFFDVAMAYGECEEAACIAQSNPHFVSDDVLRFVMAGDHKMYDALISVREKSDPDLERSKRLEDLPRLTSEEEEEMLKILLSNYHKSEASVKTSIKPRECCPLKGESATLEL